MLAVRLQGEDHALLERDLSASRQDWLLLMKPCAHAVPDE